MSARCWLENASAQSASFASFLKLTWRIRKYIFKMGKRTDFTEPYTDLHIVCVSMSRIRRTVKQRRAAAPALLAFSPRFATSLSNFCKMGEETPSGVVSVFPPSFELLEWLDHHRKFHSRSACFTPVEWTTHVETFCGETACGEFGMSVRKAMLQN
jgi:hypothetical protein